MAPAPSPRAPAASPMAPAPSPRAPAASPRAVASPRTPANEKRPRTSPGQEPIPKRGGDVYSVDSDEDEDHGAGYKRLPRKTTPTVNKPGKLKVGHSFGN